MVELKPLEISHAELVRSWRNNPEISRYMYSDHHISESEHDAWLTSTLADPTSHYWVIRLESEPVGLAGVTTVSSRHSSAEWAFYLASPAVRGKGVGSQVELSVLDFAFEELRLHRLSCAVLSFNEAVIAMHKSFGFVQEGVLRRAIRKSDGWVDVTLLAQLSNEWEENRKRYEDRPRAIRLRLPDRGPA